MSQSLALSVLSTSKAKKLSHFLENIHHDINHMFHQSSQTAIILLCSFFFCTLTYKQTFSQPYTKAHSCLFGMPLSKDRYYNWIRMQIFSQIFIHVSPSVCCVSVRSHGIQIDYLSKREENVSKVSIDSSTILSLVLFRFMEKVRIILSFYPLVPRSLPQFSIKTIFM